MARLGLHCNHTNVTYTYNNSAFKGFAANLHPASVESLNGMSDVAHVKQTSSVHHHSVTLRPDAPWGLQRISSNNAVTKGAPTQADFTYAYTTNQLGGGADIYVVDSGVYDQNEEFGGRVIQGYSFESTDADQDGHGTHVSGTAAGAHFGVASNANIISIKILGADGAGTSSATISGMDRVVNMHDSRKGQSGFLGSVMSMSWGLSSVDSVVNAAVTAAAKHGVHVVIAAGNNGADACSYTPSQLGGSQSNIISVGSIGRDDQISSFSNTGKCVDVYAPGEDVLSAWPNGTDATNIMSGTSMATPHVSGLLAILMVSEPSLANNEGALKSKLLSMAQQGLSGKSSGGGYLMLNNDLNQ
ncbi:MAG: hypothetical protein M1828_006157 [Chrysothrix sp. TS-e1954]|nr:MAG: hypothetical protein M1828_006157 [Chrysothrix sp. TS-e1954]